MSPEQSVIRYFALLDDWFDAFCEFSLAYTLLPKPCSQSAPAWPERDRFRDILVGGENAQKFGESPIVTGGK